MNDYLALRLSVEPGHHWLCTRQYQNSLAESALNGIMHSISRMGLDSLWDIPGKRARNGSKISYRGLERNPQAIRSMFDLTGCTVNEAQDVNGEDFEYHVEPTLFRTPNFQLFLLGNPISEDDWFSQFLQKEEDGVLTLRVNWKHNRYFPEGLNRLRLRDLQYHPEIYPHKWDGEFFSGSEGVWIRNLDWQRQKDESISFDAPRTKWYIGVDGARGGSNDNDLFSLAYLGYQCGPPERFVCKFRTYVCRDMIGRNTQKDYRDWVRSGHIIVTGNERIEQDPIKAQLKQDIDTLRPEGIWLDPAYTDQIQTWLSNLGPRYARVVHNFPQRAEYRTPAMLDLRSFVTDQRLFQDGDPVAGWAVSNLVPAYDDKDPELMLPSKMAGRFKIDPADALINAIYGYRTVPPRRGFISLVDPDTGEYETQ